MLRILEALDVDKWTVQDGLYLRYNATHGRFEGAPPEEAISAGVTLSPATALRNVVTAQTALTTPLTLKLAVGQTAAALVIADANGGSLVRVTAQGSLAVSGSISTSGFLGVGTLPTRRFEIYDSPIRCYYSAVPLEGGQRGWVIDKTDATDPFPHGFAYAVSGTVKWQSGMDYATLAGGGNADFVVVYHSLVPNASGGFGADIFRFSTHGAQGVKVNLGWRVGSPELNSAFLTITPFPGVSCLNMFVSGSNTVNMIGLTQQRTDLHTIRWNFNNQWIWGTDINGTGDRGWSWFDSVNSITRMYLSGATGLIAYLGVGTANPKAMVSAGATSSSTLYDIPQLYFLGSYQDLPSNRSISAQMILSAVAVRNYLFLNGTLASGSTTAAPLFYSNFASTFGLESTDSSLSLVTAAAGNNVTPIRGLTMSSIGAIQVSGALSTASTLQVWGAASFLNSVTITGRIDAGAAGFTGQVGGGASGAFQMNTYQHTFTADADYTLSGSQINALYIDVQADAVLTTGRSIILPLAAGNLWFVRNRNAQSITFKGSSGGSVTVATLKQAIINCSGANIIRMSADVTP